MKRTSRSLQIFKSATAATLAIVIICGLSFRTARAGYIVTLQRVGPDVVATGAGALDPSGLSFLGNPFDGSEIWPSSGILITGPMSPSGPADAYFGIKGPTSFGSGSLTFPSSGSGDLVGIWAAIGQRQLILPNGYVAGTALSDSATYSGQTFASLGVTVGIHEWTWGTGMNQNFTLQVGPAGVPDSGSTFGLFALTLAGLFGVSRLRFVRLA